MFCINENCENFRKFENTQVVKHGFNPRTGSPKYLCRGCGKDFSEYNKIRIKTKRIKREHGYFITHKSESENKLFYYGYEHRNIIEKILGHKLSNKCHVHHIDGDRSNNSNSNLVVCENHKYHMLLHQRAKALKECGDVNKRYCKYCGSWKEQEKFYIRGNGYRVSKCKDCCKVVG